MKIEFLCGIQRIHALPYVLIHGGSRSWVTRENFQDTALSRGQDGFMCWTIVDQGLKHVIKWKKSLCIARDCDRAWRRDQTINKVVFKVWSKVWSRKSWAFEKHVLKIWRLCKHSCLPSRHRYYENREEDTRSIKTMVGFKLINTQSLNYVQSGI